jgi:CheY-like chemotaxis protein
MTGMMGMIALLRDTKLDEEQHQLADYALDASKSLLVVINDILDFSKLEAERLTPESIDFSPAQLVDGVAALIGSRISEGVTLETAVDPGVPGWLKGDPNRIRQVLLNLASNAAKFTAHGAVRLAAHHRALDGGAIELRIEVMDTGIGIPAEVQQRLFNPFTQADSSVSRKYGGTGLGLAISKKLCAIMGGAIGVHSQPDSGSTFWFTVRCEAGAPPVVAAPPLQPVETERSLSVLVAEDNALIQKLITKLLQKRGHQFDLVTNGREVIEAARRKPYDLILMDMQMPEIDGIAATRMIRDLTGPERDTPIIALTGNALAGQREICLAAGMNDYVSKPFTPDDFYAAIRRVTFSNSLIDS